MKRTLRVGTWNVNSFTNKVSEVTTEILNHGIDIIILSETKKKGKGNELLDNFMHFWSGVDKSRRAQAGVSILLKKNLRKFFKNYNPISERLMTLTIDLFGLETVIIATYAPTNDASVQEKNEYYTLLSDTLMEIKPNQEVLLLGDLNARVGSRENSKIVGKFGEDVLNDSGERLIELCELSGLQILNGFFSHKLIHRFTRERPSLNQKSIIDYILKRQISRIKVNDCRVQRGANCGSDHRLLVAKLVVPFNCYNQNSQIQSIQQGTKITEEECKRFKLKLLYQESIKWLYQSRLNKAMEEMTPSDDVDEEYNNLKTVIKRVAEEVLGEEIRKQKKDEPLWLTDEVKQVIAEKRSKYRTWLSNQSNENWNEYKMKNREVRATIKAEKTKIWEGRCQQVESHIGGAQSTEVWRTLRQMRTNRTERLNQRIDIEKWREHYDDLLVEKRPEFQRGTIINRDQTAVTVTVQEVQTALRRMKNGRSPGPGNIPAELLKNGGHKLDIRLTALINNCCQQRKVPREWKEAHIVSLFKKGDRRDPGCYRGLSINSSASRLFGKILQAKLRQNIGQKISDDQSGFTPDRSCTDNLFILQQIIEKKIAVGQEVHLAFIDLEKAYDSVPRCKIWESLETLETDVSLLNIIKELYEDNISFVRVGSRLSDAIHPTKGLRQGCSLSPLLFNAYVEVALRDWKRSVSGMGIPISDEETIFTLSFADDQVVIAQDSDDLEFMIKRLYDTYKNWGLQVSLKKTEYLAVNTDARFEVLINDDVEINQVEKFKYLGVTLNKNGLGRQEILTRVQGAKRVVGCLNSLWWDRHLSKETKKRIGRTMVESVLCYGAELWTMGVDEKRRVQAVEMDYLRRSAGISRLERRTNEEVRRIMHATETINERIEKKGLKWFGHVMRMPEDRWPKKIFHWTPAGRRKRGRPRRSWNGTIREIMEDRDLEPNDVHDRAAWRRATGRQH